MAEDDKDRLGNKLADKEKAEEDRYFAERDRQLVEKLRQKENVAEEARARELARMRCPSCGSRLEEQELLGVTADTCPECGGMWLDRGELEQAVEHDKKTGWLTRYLDLIGKR